MNRPSGLSVEEVEEMRARFRPARVTVLFVGEAAPANGTFFYDRTSQMYREFRDVLSPKFGDPKDFVTAFVERGYFLDDLVLTPVNWLTNAERRRLHEENIISLAQRIARYRPSMIVSVLKAIEPAVERARLAAAVDVPHRCVSFPGNGRQGHFRAEMAALLHEFP
jgi:hypothetical protein